MAVYYKDYPASMIPYLGLTVFDAIKRTDTLPIEDGKLPHMVKEISDKEIVIQTYQTVYRPTTGERFFRFYMVFDVMNQIKPQCKYGEVKVTKNDSIGAITIPYPSRASFTVEWFMELGYKLETYLVNSQEYSYKNQQMNRMYFARSEHLEDRVKVDNHIHIINWLDQMNTANSDIRKYLSEEFLVSHTEEKEVTEMRKWEDEAYIGSPLYGMTMPYTHKVKRTITGFLNELQIPDYIIL